ncbi:MAG: MFS transporter [Gammaproteobacteria bacterium RIFCSPHIGHO2_12_FULL_45_9]|nr:MAG: MFS transporter [Gammaproteobacteria bacterium RIFCSPHIGHO2_12_FULL_45_9]
MDSPHHQRLRELDESNITQFHWKIVFTAGMGFFTDAYDLFVIGIVVALLAPVWHLTTYQLALLSGAALASAGVGAFIFGWLSDHFGRKKMYGLEVLILFVGAILSAMAPSFTWLLVARIIVGLGVGGDYPSSAVVVSEHAGRRHRGFLVLLVFAMQAVGLIVAPLVAALLLVLQVPDMWTWRILLGLGAIPAASVFFLRRRIEETPHFLINKQKVREMPPFEVSRVVSDLAAYPGAKRSPFKEERLLAKRWLRVLFGTAGAWFLFDVAFYGNGISTTLILKAIDPANSLLRHAMMTALIFLCFALPGYALAAKYVDRIGRKRLQVLGFVMMAVCFAVIGLFPAVREMLPVFVLVFGISFFFVNFGPNTTTFLIPSEVYPTNIRAKAHGLSAAIGKLGAFVGSFVVPTMLVKHGVGPTMLLMAGVSLLGLWTTYFVPEMKNLSLLMTEE